VDATGLVLQALAAVDRGGSDEGQAAAAWLAGWQSNDDGSFPAEAPVNATGYAAMGLQAIGRDTTRAASYLASQQNDDGGLRRGSGPSTASDAFATSQALPALVGTTFQGAARDVARLPVPCAAAVASLPQSTITVGIRGVVRVRGTSGTVVGLYAYSQPATTYRLVRTFTLGRDGTGSVAVAPGTNTRLYAQQRGCDAGASTVLSVRTALTLTATRNSVRDYTFSGTSAPTRARGLVVSIYRITADGSAVLAGQTRASATTGRWTFRRTFSGTGRFGFVARTAPDIQNAGGSSAVRSVQIS
jgi:hypothetical protein